MNVTGVKGTGLKGTEVKGTGVKAAGVKVTGWRTGVECTKAVCDRKSGSGSGRSVRFFQIRFRSGSGQIPTGSTGFD